MVERVSRRGTGRRLYLAFHPVRAYPQEVNLKGRALLRPGFAVAITQISFSITSICASIAIPLASESPAADLSLLSTVLLFQGLTRVTIGYNLDLEGRREGGAFLVVLGASAVIAVVFFSGSPLEWAAASATAGLYEILRTTLLRGAGRGAAGIVVLSDVAWMIPFLAGWSIGNLAAPWSLSAGSILAVLVLCTQTSCRHHFCIAVRPTLSFVRLKWPRLRRSLIEAWSGLLIPLGVVLVLVQFGRTDHVSAIRVVSTLMSPQGSLVGVFILLWARIDRHLRAKLLVPLSILPVLLILPVAGFPGPVRTLAAGSHAVLAFAFGWVAFGAAQTHLALLTAEERLTQRAPTVSLPFVFLVCLLSLGSAQYFAEDLGAQIAIGVIALSPWLGLCGSAFRSRRAASVG